MVCDSRTLGDTMGPKASGLMPNWVYILWAGCFGETHVLLQALYIFLAALCLSATTLFGILSEVTYSLTRLYRKPPRVQEKGDVRFFPSLFISASLNLSAESFKRCLHMCVASSRSPHLQLLWRLCTCLLWRCQMFWCGYCFQVFNGSCAVKYPCTPPQSSCILLYPCL